ncbi:putative rRNA-processing protein EBP2 [Lamellibrachia satsuma]|nr:putative rRNA-processing protein EBP2 [Lamellibrachia satsuma]
MEKGRFGPVLYLERRGLSMKPTYGKESMASDESDVESVDSDRELQIAFSKGLLKPGLNLEVEAPKEAINNVEGLTSTLTDLKNDLPWVERMDIVTQPLPAPKPFLDQLGPDPDDLGGDSVHDDFKREMRFYRQAQAAVLEGIERLHSMHIPTKRPDDYFAEMAKSDMHMKKVREKLISKQISIERSEKAKKMRELRKFGKKVQHEVLQKRQKEKREMLNAVKKYRKGQQAKLDFLDDEKEAKQKDNKTKQGPQQHKGQMFQPNQKRNYKNNKFGFGGQKKRSKYNTAKSSSSMSGFSVKANNMRPGKKSQNKQRAGKKRRQTMKSKTKR